MEIAEMIQVEKLSYGVPAKELYKDISFNLEVGQHCALIGSNGTGKSTLVDMIIHSEKYLYDGKIIKNENCRIGYASQFKVREKDQIRTVFDFLSEKFLNIQEEIAHVCEKMALEKNMEQLFENYQSLLDLNDAMDGDNYKSNIKKQLNIAGMETLEDITLAQISGGEYKILQIMKEMLLAPNLLVLDEPDIFLDFQNLNSLCQLINNYKGTLLVITHNRYLLNHCFNKILHLENCELQEYDGSYTEYRCSLLREKLKLRIQNLEEAEEIKNTEELVEILRKRATITVNPVIGRSVNAKQSQLERLKARQIKEPFLEVQQPEIRLPLVEAKEEHKILSITGHQIAFDKLILEDVNFNILAGEKVAIVGANGTGKTTLIRDIINNNHPSVNIDKNVKYACLSQLQGENIDGSKTVYQVMQDKGFGSRSSIIAHISKYCLDEEYIDQKVETLSGGEQNLLQLAIIANSEAEFLIMDEPTSHLDIHAQSALEKAISEYKGAVLMVTHDFYLVANCADYVLIIEDNTVRQMRTRKFRKMVYNKYFDQKYLETDKKKQELEENIALAFKKNDLTTVEKLCVQLEEISVI